MAVCRLAILSYRDRRDYGGYDIHDLKDSIAFARYSVECNELKGFDGQDWRGFIGWAKHKISILKG